MDLTWASWLLDNNVPSSPSPPPKDVRPARLDETSCGSLCQHPSCWASQRRQEKGIARVLPPIEVDSDSSDDEIHLPTQSIHNLLGDYGDSSSDRYPLSTGGRPSHQWDTNSFHAPPTAQSLTSGLKLTAPHNTTASSKSKPSRSRGLVRNARLRLVEVQEVFDREDLNKVWDETFVTKQYYVWVPNPNRKRRKIMRNLNTSETNQSKPVLLKDLTESMVPTEIEHKREETVLFDEWPVLKKKQPRTKSPPSKSVSYNRVAQGPGSLPAGGSIDTDGINELLALPRDTLMKVLERTKKSDFTSKGKLHSIVQACARDDENAQLALTARELFQHKKIQLAEDQGRKSYAPDPRPVFQLDDDGVIDRLSSANTHVKEKDILFSDAGSVDSFPRYKRPLPGISGDTKGSRMLVSNNRVKIPSISLGLPELPSGVKTTKPFSYKRQEVDFSLGPVITPPSSYRSSLSGTYSDHGTTVKVNASSTNIGHLDSNFNREGDEMAIHCVSPALSTHVPIPPAGTPATFQSPTKSAPVFRDYRDIYRDPTQATVNWSQRAAPPSQERDARENTTLSSPAQMQREVTPRSIKPDGTPDDQGLDTINETARENQEGSVTSSRKADKTARSPVGIIETGQPTLQLETSMLRSIDTAASPREKSARSVESCPSPEQWPLISESSFERLPRPSVSEPALSARSDRRRPISRGKDDSGKQREFARKVLDEKMSAESPAPPPPSPEPKDHGEFRSRKDLKSRDSLSMAPLFEVAELEENSPIRELHDMPGRQEQSRKIEVKIPTDKDDKIDMKGDGADHQDGEMVSQITVMHVAPKGRDPHKKEVYEKVQETFLNVDIPAEDISSLKAEHGSSHQEDISSNGTIINSQSTATGSEASPTPRGQGSEVKGNIGPDEGKDTEAPLAAIDEQEQLKAADDDAAAGHDLQLDREGEEEKEGENLNMSGESTELMCDSARFFSHDLVSPMEEEKDLESSQRFVLGAIEQETGDECEGQDKDAPIDQGKSLEVTDDKPDGVAEAETSKSAAGNAQDETKEKEGEDTPEAEAPGSFFFLKTSPDKDSSEEMSPAEGQNEAEAEIAISEDTKETEAEFVATKPSKEKENGIMPQDTGNSDEKEDVRVVKEEKVSEFDEEKEPEKKGQKLEPEGGEQKLETEHGDLENREVGEGDSSSKQDNVASETGDNAVISKTVETELDLTETNAGTATEAEEQNSENKDSELAPQVLADSSVKESGDTEGDENMDAKDDKKNEAISDDNAINTNAENEALPSEPQETEDKKAVEEEVKSNETDIIGNNEQADSNSEDLPSREQPEGGP